MTPAAEAIVVLGAALDAAGRPSPALRRRTLRGAALHAAGAAPLLVLSGGGVGPRPEAAVMAEIAREAGVPPASLLLEERSADTFENALMTGALLRPRRIARVILVSDGYHLPRARFLFRLAGLAVVGTASAPPPPWPARLPLVIRESAAFAKSLVLAAFGAQKRARNKLLSEGGR